jgi:hypothetical protein
VQKQNGYGKDRPCDGINVKIQYRFSTEKEKDKKENSGAL